MADQQVWTDDVYRILREWDVTQFSYVPDAGHTVVINRSLEDPEVHSVPLTTEEEGVAMLAGAHLGGARGVVLMQSSGVGNCANMFSLVKNGQFPMLLLISMRGDFGEGNPWQMPMGQATQPILEACGFICVRVEEPDEVAACLPYIREQIRLIQPEVLVTLGRVAAWNLLGTQDAMKNLRGRTLLYEGIPVVATWHPAYLLRNPAAKAGTWDDIKRVNRLLGNPEVPG